MGAPAHQTFDKGNRQAFVSDEDSGRQWQQRQSTSPTTRRSSFKGATTNSRHVTFSPKGKTEPALSQHAPPLNTNINPAFGQNQVFTHNPHQPQQQSPFGFPLNQFGAQTFGGGQILVTPPTQTVLYAQQPPIPIGLQPTIAPATVFPISTPGQAASSNMGEYYRNSAPIVQGASFQPQVPSTQNGPELHYYFPRHDATQFFQPGLQVCHPAQPSDLDPTKHPLLACSYKDATVNWPSGYE
jgi:hypothetical protein